MQRYTVKPNDSLWKLSKRHNVSIKTLADINNLKGKQIHHLSVGQKLYIPGDGSCEPDTCMAITFRGLDFAVFTPKRIQVEHDGKIHERRLDDDQKLRLSIHDHTQGLKVWIEDMDKKMILVAEKPMLSLGYWKAFIDSRMVKLVGNMLPATGKPETTRAQLKETLTRKVQQAGGHTVQIQTRVEDGTPVHAFATIYTTENLRLFQGNEKYRQYLITAAKAHGHTPQMLAALIDAEAAKKSGVWDEKSNATHPERAQGLCQFFPDGWKDVMKEQSSLLCLECQGLSEEDILAKRLEAKYAIDAAATYAKMNLRSFAKRTGLAVDDLSYQEKAKVAYLLHHEGVEGVMRLLELPGTKKGPYEDKEALHRLSIQLGKENVEKFNQIFEQYGSDGVAAYKGWLFTYVDCKINVNNFIVQDKQLGTPLRSTDEIMSGLCSKPPLPKPQKKSTPVAPASGTANSHKNKGTPASKDKLSDSKFPPHESSAAANSEHEAQWFDPLEVCTLRTGHLSSKRQAEFGMTRCGGTKAHQGIDLAALPGTPIRAVANGRVYISPMRNRNDAYGDSLILRVGINDLPPSQAELFRKVNPGAVTIGFFYAHLSEFSQYPPKKYYDVFAGDVIGKTGCTGNAEGMNTFEKGAHLHFEVRKDIEVRCIGLQNRVDPLPFIKNCTNR